MAAGEAVGPVHLAVRAHLQQRVRHQRPPDALDREAAAEPPRAAGVGHEAVALDQDRPVGLGHLDGDVGHARARVREAVVAVGDGPAAPRPDDQLAVDERLAAVAGPEKKASVLPPSPAAGTRSGTSWASAPFITSERR